MAAALQVKVGAPINIQEGQSGWWSPYTSWWGTRSGGMLAQNVMQDRRAAGAGEDVLLPGQVSVSANVSVTFELGAER